MKRKGVGKVKCSTCGKVIAGTPRSPRIRFVGPDEPNTLRAWPHKNWSGNPCAGVDRPQPIVEQ